MIAPLEFTDGVCTRADLIAAGMRPRQITRAVQDGTLLRIRRDRYTTASRHRIDEAVRIGGRLGCVSLLAVLGVFVLDGSLLHVHVEHTMSRMRSLQDRSRTYGAADRRGTQLHWSPLHHEPTLGVVGIADALAQAVRCESARAAVATVDSILHLGLMTMVELQDLFRLLPRRYAPVLALADATAESGPETYMRLILRQLGLRYRTQVMIPTVGRVDFLVEGWLIIECDSRAHHEGWAKQRSDRRRDLAAAARGLTTLRPLAEDLLFDSARVVSAVRGIVAAHGRTR